jgi:hypothetical protein
MADEKRREDVTAIQEQRRRLKAEREEFERNRVAAARATRTVRCVRARLDGAVPRVTVVVVIVRMLIGCVRARAPALPAHAHTRAVVHVM